MTESVIRAIVMCMRLETEKTIRVLKRRVRLLREEVAQAPLRDPHGDWLSAGLYYGALPDPQPWCPVCGLPALGCKKLGPGRVRYQHEGEDFCVGAGKAKESCNPNTP